MQDDINKRIEQYNKALVMWKADLQYYVTKQSYKEVMTHAAKCQEYVALIFVLEQLKEKQ